MSPNIIEGLTSTTESLKDRVGAEAEITLVENTVTRDMTVIKIIRIRTSEEAEAGIIERARQQQKECHPTCRTHTSETIITLRARDIMRTGNTGVRVELVEIDLITTSIIISIEDLRAEG